MTRKYTTLLADLHLSNYLCNVEPHFQSQRQLNLKPGDFGQFFEILEILFCGEVILDYGVP